jgi:SNF2 family DNA or RNA helicase
MNGVFHLLRRQVRVRLNARAINRELIAARKISDESRLRVMTVRDEFERDRGVGAVPNTEDITPLDRELIVSLSMYNDVRRHVELPLREALREWENDMENRQQSLSLSHLFDTIFSKRKRKAFDKELQASETTCAEILKSIRESIRPQSRRCKEKYRNINAGDIDEAVALYRANNAPFVVALERLNFFTSPITGAPHRGLHGGLPETIADEVESFELKQGPLVAMLRRYQEFGARYIALQKRTLLGDDMGLGKTVQVLATMCHLHAEGARHFLVVAPNSVLLNWEREVQKHTELRSIVVHGGDRTASLMEWQALGGVAITTYGTLPKILDLVSYVDLLAVDEAHYAKNPSAMRTQAVQHVASRSAHVVLMTGTALENRLSELNFLVVLAQPEMEPTINRIMNSPAHTLDPTVVVQELAPVYLRRTQRDVLQELPERIVTDEWVELTPEDRSAYREGQGDLMTKRLLATRGDGTRSSAKYERLLEILEEHRSADRKVVVFSFFRHVIDDVCALAGGAPQITGSTSSAERQRIIDVFSTDPTQRILVLQVDAGGVGINLQSAQVVVLMEAQFKPSTEWQAIARVHRMGQSRTVNVHRLLARNTIEERLVEIVAAKAELFAAFAHESSVRDASAMAVDARSPDVETELRRLLNEDPDL